VAGNVEWLSKKLGVPVIDPAKTALEITIKMLAHYHACAFLKVQNSKLNLADK